jgi:hypothetical protein
MLLFVGLAANPAWIQVSVQPLVVNQCFGSVFIFDTDPDPAF